VLTDPADIDRVEPLKEEPLHFPARPPQQIGGQQSQVPSTPHTRGRFNAPQTRWDLITINVEPTGHPSTPLYLPAAWQEELTYVLNSETLFTGLVSLFQFDCQERFDLFGWLASCILRDRRIKDLPVADRAHILLGTLRDVANMVEELSLEELRALSATIDNGANLDLAEYQRRAAIMFAKT
jgi:hypothetical protein